MADFPMIDKIEGLDSRFHGNDKKIIDGDIRFPFTGE